MKPSIWTIPIHTVSEANKNWHWSKKKKLHDVQARWLRIWQLNEKPVFTLPCVIILSRGAKRRLDDDNLPVSMKFIRDYIADMILPGMAKGQADSDKRIRWVYSQHSSSECEVRVTYLSHN
jgi:hypothetical protein